MTNFCYRIKKYIYILFEEALIPFDIPKNTRTDASVRDKKMLPIDSLEDLYTVSS